MKLPLGFTPSAKVHVTVLGVADKTAPALMLHFTSVAWAWASSGTAMYEATARPVVTITRDKVDFIAAVSFPQVIDDKHEQIVRRHVCMPPQSTGNEPNDCSSTGPEGRRRIVGKRRLDCHARNPPAWRSSKTDAWPGTSIATPAR